MDLFSGYVVARASALRTARTIAEEYEDCVFRRFGVNEGIRQDREPGFMSYFFRAFSKIAEKSNVLIWPIALERMAQQNA